VTTMTEYDPHRFPHGAPEGFVDVRPMADGRAWGLHRLTFGRLRITIMPDQFSMGEHW
jgi:hypothetical protein